MVVYKYNLPVEDVSIIKIPMGSQLLSVEEQNGEIVVYALIPDSRHIVMVDVKFRVAGTGHSVDYRDTKNFLGTVRIREKFFFHVFYSGL